MTIAEYVEYKKKVNENHISNTKSYLPIYFRKSTSTHDPIQEFAHYFGPNQPGAESDCDSKDIEEHIQHFEEMDGVNGWLNAEITKHMNIRQEEETFNPLEIRIDLLSYESPTCLEFEQRTRSYGTPKPQDEIADPICFSPDRRGLVKRWHICKPIHVTYDDGSGEDCGMWPTCDPDSKFCFGYNEVFGVNEQGSLRLWICFRDHERRTVKGSYIGFADFLQVCYGQQNIDDTTRE
ncbi:hypothetical protein Tco_1006262 [Tanacetum coccineum]|uniref:Uncharacterized protein n=1 Tax=Tanacetum coccineum TaxID=301880 RepID=A0ABQ5FHS8_9ASTR